jgi:hypothetical protein
MTSHVREVGPHGHAWVVTYLTESVALQECTTCGSRRAVAAHDERAICPILAPWQQDWTRGAPLPDTALLVAHR